MTLHSRSRFDWLTVCLQNARSFIRRTKSNGDDFLNSWPFYPYFLRHVSQTGSACGKKHTETNVWLVQKPLKISQRVLFRIDETAVFSFWLLPLFASFHFISSVENFSMHSLPFLFMMSVCVCNAKAGQTDSRQQQQQQEPAVLDRSFVALALRSFVLVYVSRVPAHPEVETRIFQCATSRSAFAYVLFYL